ncbi:MAG: CoA transferase [Chloroflexi bacterium]|nr:CoA transferase [Chloroflexota bacterium]
MALPALAGVVVLDLTTYYAGPYCTKLLAALGAEVIKIERPGLGDGARRLGPFPGDLPHPEKSGTFLYLNTGKQGITLNLKSATGQELFKQLVREATIVVENFAPRVLPGLGLGYEVLEQINSALVLTSISNFGQTGPYRDYRGAEITFMALGGLMYQTGEPDREPLKLPGAVAQYAAGFAAFSATLGALYYAEATGTGQHVDVSLMETIASSHIQGLSEYDYVGTIRGRGYAQAHYPCQDGFVAFSVQPHLWPRLCQLIGRPELVEDPRFRTWQARRQHADELDMYILPWVVERTREQVYHEAQAAGVPCSFMATMADLEASPQYRARGFFSAIEHPVAGSFPYPGIPFQLGEAPYNLGRAPLLGEHNAAVYGERLGYSREALARLQAQGVV